MTTFTDCMYCMNGMLTDHERAQGHSKCHSCRAKDAKAKQQTDLTNTISRANRRVRS